MIRARLEGLVTRYRTLITDPVFKSDEYGKGKGAGIAVMLDQLQSILAGPECVDLTSALECAHVIAMTHWCHENDDHEPLNYLEAVKDADFVDCDTASYVEWLESRYKKPLPEPPKGEGL